MKERNLTFFAVNIEENKNFIIFAPFSLKKKRNNKIYSKIPSFYEIWTNNTIDFDFVFDVNDKYFYNTFLEFSSLNYDLNTILDIYRSSFNSYNEKENNLAFLKVLYNFSYLKKLNYNFFSSKINNASVYKIIKSNKNIKIKKFSLNDYLNNFEKVFYHYYNKNNLAYFQNLSDNLSFQSFINMAKMYRYHVTGIEDYQFLFFKKIGEKIMDYRPILNGEKLVDFLKNRFFQQIVYLSKKFENEDYNDLKNRSMITVLIDKPRSNKEVIEIVNNFKNALQCEKKNMKKFITYNNFYFEPCFSVVLKNKSTKEDLINFLKSVGVYYTNVDNLFISNKEYYDTCNIMRMISFDQDLDIVADFGSILKYET